jgi:hypothetical protein
VWNRRSSLSPEQNVLHFPYVPAGALRREKVKVPPPSHGSQEHSWSSLWSPLYSRHGVTVEARENFHIMNGRRWAVVRGKVGDVHQRQV